MAEPKPKIGAGHLSAMLRLGLRELRAVFYPESDVAQPSEYGVFGTRTPGEVAADRRDDPQVQRLEQESPGRSPSQIADARGHQGGGVEPGHRPQQQQHEHGHEMNHEM